MQDKLVEWFAEDLGKGDVTSLAVVNNEFCNAKVTGGPGVISGLRICKILLKQHSINFTTEYEDGDTIVSPLIFSLEGKSHDILATERLLLNILSHLSGISTHTNKIVRIAKKVNPNVEILATRKTLPGLRDIEKRAVVHGGGATHRMRLDEAILIKDNHLYEYKFFVCTYQHLAHEFYKHLLLEYYYQYNTILFDYLSKLSYHLK